MTGIKCRDCANLVHDWCKPTLDSPHPDMDRDCSYFRQKTNFDFVSNLSIEEMAEWLFGLFDNCSNCHIGRRGGCDKKVSCDKSILKWLMAPVDEDDFSDEILKRLKEYKEGLDET